MDTQEHIKKYEQHLKIQNYAPSTIKSNLRYINKFFEYCQEKEISDISKEMIFDYQVYQYELINKRGTLNTVMEQNNALKPVKQFFRFLAENGFIINDPVKKIPYAKEPKRLPKTILTEKEVRKILSKPDLSSAIGYRDRTILELLYSTGIRKNELNNLKISEADTKDGYLRINKGKGNKDRVVPIGKIAAKYIENYTSLVRAEFKPFPKNTYLFISATGNKLSKNIVWEIVKKYTNQAGIKKNVTPHTFRHTCATSMLRNLADLRSIQELLGHSSLDSTQIYTKVTITDLKETHKRCHPRERDKD